MNENNTFDPNDWRVLPDTKDRYGINWLGQIINFRTNKILTQTLNSKGFLKSNTCVDYKFKTWVIHLWVAKFFVPNHRDLKEVGFKDGNRLNVCANNLEWVKHHAHRNNAYYEYGNNMIKQNEIKRNDMANKEYQIDFQLMGVEFTVKAKDKREAGKKARAKLKKVITSHIHKIYIDEIL